MNDEHSYSLAINRGQRQACDCAQTQGHGFKLISEKSYLKYTDLYLESGQNSCGDYWHYLIY